MKTKRLFIILLILLLLLAVVLIKHKNNPVEVQTIDLELLALPLNDGNIVRHTGYTLCYSEEDEQSLWVAYVLTPEEVNSPSVKRKDSFREDPAIETGSATLKDYKGSGFDRGHLAPFADLAWSEQSADESFFLSNMSPQNSSLNRGKWAELEKTVRSFAEQEAMCIVTGPVLSDGPFEKIGENGVSVPNCFYKVVLDWEGDEVKAIGFILPNEKCTDPLSSYAVCVDDVEQATGLDFFYLLPNEIEEILESSFNLSQWGL